MDKTKKSVLISISVVFVLLVTAVLVPYFLTKNKTPKTPETPETPETEGTPGGSTITPTPETPPFIYEMSEDGKYVYFGEYPQSLKENSVTIVTSEPDENGYYLGSDGERYVKQQVVTWSEDTLGFSKEDAEEFKFTTAKNGTVMEQGVEYYFKVEKIKWRILATEDGWNAIVCDNILNVSAYQPNFTFISSDDTENGLEGGEVYATSNGGVTTGETDLILRDEENNPIYANNYKYSELRRFLTTDFYNLAFTTEQKELIELITVDNSGWSTSDVENKYACEDTGDYVFALGYADLIDPDFGFAGDYNEEEGYSIVDANRAWETTDFAKANGALTFTKELAYDALKMGDLEIDAALFLCIGTGILCSRSPVNGSPGAAVAGVITGFFEFFDVDYPGLGVAPALVISLQD